MYNLKYGTLFNVRRMEVCEDTDWLVGMREYARDRGSAYGDKLFVYRSKRSGNHVLAVWIEEPVDEFGVGGIMIELATRGLQFGQLFDWRGYHPEQSDDFYMAMLEPQREKARAHRMRLLAEKSKEADRQDANIAYAKAVAKMARRTEGNHSPLPKMLEDGLLPMTAPEVMKAEGRDDAHERILS